MYLINIYIVMLIVMLLIMVVANLWINSTFCSILLSVQVGRMFVGLVGWGELIGDVFGIFCGRFSMG